MGHVIAGIFFGMLTISFFICFGFTIKDKFINLWYVTCGILTLLATVAVFVDKETKHMYQLISECEQTLPRNQHCELIAIPKDK